MVKRRPLDITMIGICASLYAVVGLLTDLGITVGAVAFWPAAFIPAVFAVLFGPMIGATGAALGIFIRDLIFHGDPLLSLLAGVTGNFSAFFLVGYVSRTKLDWKKLSTAIIIAIIIIIAGLLLPTVLLPVESMSFTELTTLETVALFSAPIIISLVAIVAIFKSQQEWRKFGVGSVIGAGVGSGIIALAVYAYSQIFFNPSGYIKTPMPKSFIPIIFVWTFVTEIPFILVLGPPIIKACYRAFPSLKDSKM